MLILLIVVCFDLFSYTGGTLANPSYDAVCSDRTGHTESVQLVYDPKSVSYSKLLEIFGHKHDMTLPNQAGNDKGTQYRSGIFTHSPEQLAEAKAFCAKQESKLGRKVITEVKPITDWWPAENHHQKHLEVSRNAHTIAH